MIGLGIGVRRCTVGVGVIPLRSSALFWLDGAIELNGSDYYFTDKTGNNRDFLITDKDFTASYFPYKSAATISAPAGDATLIAADINNFLYNASDYPNEIPIVSLFQDIDYEHKGFTRHVTQTVDANGVEVVEPHVKDFAWYSAVLSGGDLTLAQSYYNVTTEDATALWVAKNGNDTTGNGTKALPYLTIDKAYKTTDGIKPTYIKSGVYAEDVLVKGTYFALGLVDIKIQSTTGFTGLTNARSYGFIIDANGNNKGIASGAQENVIHNKNLLKNALNYNYQATATTSLTLTNVIINANNSETDLIYCSAVAFNLLKSKLTGVCSSRVIVFITTAGPKTLRYNKIDAYSSGAGSLKTIAYINVNGNFIFEYNEVLTTQGLTTLFLLGTGEYTGDFKFNYNEIDLPILTSRLFQLPTTSNYDVEIKGNTVEVDTSNTGPLFDIINQNSLIFNENKITHNAGGTVTSPILQIGALVATGTEISKNVFNKYCNIIITGTTDDTLTINRNNIIGFENHNDVTINIFESTIKEVLYNRILAGLFHIAFTNCANIVVVPVGHNVLIDTYFTSIPILGCDDMLLHNNTIVRTNLYGNTHTSGFYAFFIEKNDSTSRYCTNVKIKNNIMVYNQDYDGVSNFYKFVFVEQAENLTGFECDYNIYYSKRSDGKMFAIGANFYTFAEWQALGYDAHSVLITSESEMKALFTDYDNGDYSLASGSAAIGVGETLAAAYDDGLDASTDWGSSTQVPTVVTKQQTAPWDIGAYVS